MVSFTTKSNISFWKKLLPSALLGIGLSSRSNFILVLPLLFSSLVQTAGWKHAIKYTTVTCLVLVAITLPFWLYDPLHFSPFFEQSFKITQFQPTLPCAGIIIPFISVGVAIALSFQRMEADCIALFRNCAIVQAFPVFCVLFLSWIQTGNLNLIWAGYGMFFLFFGSVAFWACLNRNRIVSQRLEM